MQWVNGYESVIRKIAWQYAAPGVIAHAVDLFAAFAPQGLRQSLRILVVEFSYSFTGQGIQGSDGILWQASVATQL
ncbi:hypothetical protein D3C76_1810410 [compost metagenome]